MTQNDLSHALLKAVRKSFTYIALGLFTWTPAYAWELKKNEQDIQVYTQHIEGSEFQAFRGKTRIKASIKKAVAFNMDLKRTPDWLHECKESRLLNQISDQEHYIYYVTDAPWPVSDRDYILHSTIDQDPATLAVTIRFRAVTDNAEASDDCVRVTEINGFWRFTPAQDGWLEVEYETHADPNGDIPAWLANSFVVEQPFQTLLKWREAVLSRPVDLGIAHFIQEPGQPEKPSQNSSISP